MIVKADISIAYDSPFSRSEAVQLSHAGSNDDAFIAACETRVLWVPDPSLAAIFSGELGGFMGMNFGRKYG
jgi:hypothetical protein